MAEENFVQAVVDNQQHDVVDEIFEWESGPRFTT